MEPQAAILLKVTYGQIERAARVNYLSIMGGFHPEPQTGPKTDSQTGDNLPKECKTLLLLGPLADFWTMFTSSAEWLDKNPDPVDRWSTRVISDLATQFDGDALFPFGGPPHWPFFDWALKTGHAWKSPVQLLVHSKAGLMVSYRGALALTERIELPAPESKPCESCDQPCVTACIPRALSSGKEYDLPACHAYLDTAQGHDNLVFGCSVRRACPLSRSYGTDPHQTAYHMGIFHGASR